MTTQAVRTDRSAAHRKRAFGFTLLELLTALTVAGIVLATGVPSYQAMVRNNRASANANALVAALSTARSEAVRRSDRVSLCRSSDGEECGDSWEDGWIVFVDGAASDAADPVVGQVLGIWTAPAGEASIATMSGGVAEDIEWIRFLPRGDTRTTELLPITYRIEIDNCTGDVARNIEINTVGRTSVARDTC